ncbi:MAG TPA: hypothetical protein VF067_02905 [Sphingomicrobium sp.]
MTALIHQLWHVTAGGMRSWYEAKIFIEHASVVSSDALHLLVGTLGWLLVAFALRKPITRWQPWLLLLAAIAFNECVDLWIERWPDLAMQYGETAKDVFLTMALPTALMWMARARPQLFAAGRGKAR